MLHFSPEVHVAAVSDRAFDLERDGEVLRLSFESAMLEVDVLQSWVSDRYGYRERARVVQARTVCELPAIVRCVIAPAAAEMVGEDDDGRTELKLT